MDENYVDEQVLRARWERGVESRWDIDRESNRQFYDWAWEGLAADRDVAIALGNLEFAAEELVESTHHWVEGLHLEPPSRTPASSGTRDFTRQLQGADVYKQRRKPGTDGPAKTSVGARISAISEYISKIAAVDPYVVGFRDRVLGSPTQTLSAEEAHRLVSSPAACFFPLELFGELGISPLEHEATLERHDTVLQDGESWHRATIFFDSHDIRRTVNFQDVGRGTIVRLWWPGEGGYANPIAVWVGSLLGEVQQLSKRLARKHPWKEDQAAYFILCCGDILAGALMGKWSSHTNKGVAAHLYNRTTITLTADSWLPAQIVAEAYRSLQRQIHGKKNRRPELRNVEVFRFVLDKAEVEITDRGERLGKLALSMTWREILEDWNRVYPEADAWHYKNARTTGVQNFRRDFDRGQEAVIGTRFGLPGVPDQPRTAAETKAAFERMLENLKRPGAVFVEATDEEIS
jgi:hypothetical protein